MTKIAFMLPPLAPRTDLAGRATLPPNITVEGGARLTMAVDGENTPGDDRRGRAGKRYPDGHGGGRRERIREIDL